MLIERSQVVVGLVVAVVLAAGSAYAVTLQAGALTTGTDVVVELADADRVEAGAPVRVAGVRVGQVMGVEIAGDHVEVTVRTGEPLPVDSRAEVGTTNAMGARAVDLVPGDDWDRLLADQEQPRIPLERTQTLTDLPDVTDDTVALLEESDPEAAARLLTSLADVTEDQHDQVGELLDGLQRVGDVVVDNREELETFLADTGELVEVLNDADADLLRTIDGMTETTGALNERRAELVEFVRSTAAFSRTTADLVEGERARIDDILDRAGALLATVDEHQVDVAHLLGYGGVAFEGFSSVAQSGGQDNPYWGNILTSSAGAVGVEAVGGCGAMLDQVLDELLGPGPECPPEERSRVDHAEQGEPPGPDLVPGGDLPVDAGAADDDSAEGDARADDAGSDGAGPLARFLGQHLGEASR